MKMSFKHIALSASLLISADLSAETVFDDGLGIVAVCEQNFCAFQEQYGAVYYRDSIRWYFGDGRSAHDRLSVSHEYEPKYGEYQVLFEAKEIALGLILPSWVTVKLPYYPEAVAVVTNQIILNQL